MPEKENIQRREGYEQVCVWRGATLGDHTPTDFEQWFKDQGYDIQFLEIIETGPDYEDGCPVEGTGGRSDIFFGVHRDTVGSNFVIWKLDQGISWIEDVLDNEEGPSLYPKRVKKYRTW